MKHLKFILTMATVFGCLTYAFAASAGMTLREGLEDNVWVAALTPVAVWAATWIFNNIIPKVPPMLIMVLVAGLSTAFTYLTGVFESTDTGFVLQIVAGFGAVFVNELLKALGMKKSKSKTKILALEAEIERLRAA